MGNAGSPYALWQRSLKTGNANLALDATLELGRPLKLPEALALVLVLARAQDPRWERMAVRWAARYLQEARPAPDAAEASLVLAAAGALGGSSASTAVEALHALADARGRDDLIRTLNDHGPQR